MRIFLLRHAQTADNLLGRYVGKIDPPLCAEGTAHAQEIPPRQDVARVYTSTLRRTVETAGILYPQAQPIPREGLSEMDFGAFDGKSWREMEGDMSYRAWVDAGCEPPCPDGEDRAGFVRRCTAAFLEILEEERARGAEEVCFVVHGGTIMAVLSTLAAPARDYFDWKVAFCGGYLLEDNPGGERPLRVVESITPGEGREKR